MKCRIWSAEFAGRFTYPWAGNGGLRTREPAAAMRRAPPAGFRWADDLTATPRGPGPARSRRRAGSRCGGSSRPRPGSWRSRRTRGSRRTCGISTPSTGACAAPASCSSTWRRPAGGRCATARSAAPRRSSMRPPRPRPLSPARSPTPGCARCSRRWPTSGGSSPSPRPGAGSPPPGAATAKARWCSTWSASPRAAAPSGSRSARCAATNASPSARPAGCGTWRASRPTGKNPCSRHPRGRGRPSVAWWSRAPRSSTPASVRTRRAGGCWRPSTR